MAVELRSSHGTSELITRIVEALEEFYGRAEYSQRFEPMDELVSCILSQHTTDKTSFPAFFRLKEKYPSWDEVVIAGPDAIADVIRAAGLANQKARSIVACLKAIRDRVGSYHLDHLANLPVSQAREWLEELPGVGPKTASIVLSFAFGMDAIPVDTHIFRVGWRLGLYEKKLGADQAHDLLLAIVPPGLAYRFHVALIQHGRSICKSQKPRCDQCTIRNMCAFGQSGSIDGARQGSRQAHA